MDNAGNYRSNHLYHKTVEEIIDTRYVVLYVIGYSIVSTQVTTHEYRK